MLKHAAGSVVYHATWSMIRHASTSVVRHAVSHHSHMQYFTTRACNKVKTGSIGVSKIDKSLCGIYLEQIRGCSVIAAINRSKEADRLTGN